MTPKATRRQMLGSIAILTTGCLGEAEGDREVTPDYGYDQAAIRGRSPRPIVKMQYGRRIGDFKVEILERNSAKEMHVPVYDMNYDYEVDIFPAREGTTRNYATLTKTRIEVLAVLEDDPTTYHQMGEWNR